ncbi:MAG: DUF6089 family protein [Bacteroidia bacterium]
MYKILAFLLLLWLPNIAQSQYWEAGVFLGGSNYTGELTPGVVVWSESHLAGGGLVRYNISRRFALKGHIYYGSISGSDENAKREENRIRNLNFRSSLLEFGLQFEYNLMEYETGTKWNFAPFIFAGLGVYRYNPQAIITTRASDGSFEEEYVELQPLGTEGQELTQYQNRKKYNLTQLSIPFGAGLKFSISGHMNIGVEIGPRFTYNDYLDDISQTYVEDQLLRAQNGPLAARLANRTGEVLGEPLEVGPHVDRGNSSTFDWYHFAGFTVTYSFYRDVCYGF